MTIVLVSDIFGRTPAFEALANSLADITGSQTILFDPYQGENLNFTDEQAAYQYFSQHIGVETYADMLVKFLTSLNQDEQAKPLTVLGFSVGASVAWLLACHSSNTGLLPDKKLSNNNLPEIKQVIGIYGGQIRNYSALEPDVETRLIFPQSESHFEVTALTEKLATKENVSAYQVPYLHGYLNSHSKNYNQVGYDSFLADFNCLISE
ncbi:hypothetical protein [Thalassotalea euphylliae]|uniref:Dienelactone hydrolase domain-containing protein n=1 Tax=Thalassotalea euphylliae TaxID=1655234 RepID=A0A3E0U6Z0_9GAMM|nr:hypothetical protein [Thalassotalea euphylliae]REL32550.1 hypothetical protein DXX94_00395 [Thalassotalea euphylliae]